MNILHLYLYVLFIVFVAEAIPCIRPSTTGNIIRASMDRALCTDEEIIEQIEPGGEYSEFVPDWSSVGYKNLFLLWRMSRDSLLPRNRVNHFHATREDYLARRWTARVQKRRLPWLSSKDLCLSRALAQNLGLLLVPRIGVPFEMLPALIYTFSPGSERLEAVSTFAHWKNSWGYHVAPIVKIRKSPEEGEGYNYLVFDQSIGFDAPVPLFDWLGLQDNLKLVSICHPMAFSARGDCRIISTKEEAMGLLRDTLIYLTSENAHMRAPINEDPATYFWDAQFTYETFDVEFVWQNTIPSNPHPLQNILGPDPPWACRTTDPLQKCLGPSPMIEPGEQGQPDLTVNSPANMIERYILRKSQDLKARVANILIDQLIERPDILPSFEKRDSVYRRDSHLSWIEHYYEAWTSLPTPSCPVPKHALNGTL